MGIKNNHSKDNSKNNNNCLAVFFGIIHLDDELKSPSSAGGQQIWFLRWVCGFGWSFIDRQVVKGIFVLST